MATIPKYKMSIDCLASPVQLRVNDLPVFENESGSRTRNGLLNEYLMDGTNTVSIQVGAEDRPVTSGSMSLAISRGAEKIGEYRWKPGGPAKFPVVVTNQFESGTVFGPRAWQRAERLQLDPGTIRGAQQWVRALAEAMRNRDVSATLSRLRLKSQHQAQSFGYSLEEIEHQDRQLFDELFRTRGWSLLSIDYSNLRYELFGGDRVVRLRRDNGDCVIQSAPNVEGTSFTMDVLLARSGGHWQAAL